METINEEVDQSLVNQTSQADQDTQNNETSEKKEDVFHYSHELLLSLCSTGEALPENNPENPIYYGAPSVCAQGDGKRASYLVYKYETKKWYFLCVDCGLLAELEDVNPDNFELPNANEIFILAYRTNNRGRQKCDYSSGEILLLSLDEMIGSMIEQAENETPLVDSDGWTEHNGVWFKLDNNIRSL